MAGECDKIDWKQRASVWGIRLRQWLGRMVRHFLRPGATAIAAVDIVYAICEVLREEGIPSEHIWIGHQHPLAWLLGVSGVMALLGTGLLFVGFDRVVRRTSQDDDLYEACKGVWRLMVEKYGVPMDRVGVHVWEVRGIKGFRYLSRRSSFVIQGRRGRPHVLWRRGKGAIGIAWEENDTLIANVENLRQLGTDEHAFCALPRRDRFGLSWREFRRTSRRHAAVLAVPIRDRGHVRGILSVDVQVSGHLGNLDTLAGGDELANVLRVCEAVLEG